MLDRLKIKFRNLFQFIFHKVIFTNASNIYIFYKNWLD